MNKKDLSERDICTKYITPALEKAGWDIELQVREEVSLTKGRVIVRGKIHTRGKNKRADYILYYKPHIPIAVIEAKDNKHSVADGMQQALEYAKMVKVPFVFSSNGDAFHFYNDLDKDGNVEKEIAIDNFPTPENLWSQYCKANNFSDAQNKVITHDYYNDGSGKIPRYYQVNAINKTIEAIAKGGKRVLMVMATGTGKTYTAFQIIWRLWKSKQSKRILFLADRNILVDQTKTNDFKPFGNVMTKIKKRQADKSYEIYLSLYQAVTGTEEEKNIYKQFSEDFDFNDSSDRHLFGDIYEKILKDLQSAGNAGEYYTPRAVTQFMVDMVNPKLGEKIFDPACGTGGFLAHTILHLEKQVKNNDDSQVMQASIFGVEKKPLPHLLATTNMLLHGIEIPFNIKHDNTLSRPLRDITPKDRVHCIITNPPFGGMEEDGIEANFPKTFQTRETADLFLVYIIQMLRPGGRAAIVLPDGSLFGEGVKTKIKRKLLDECNLHTIIRLPNGVFNPYTGIKTNLLFFTKGEPTKKIWYYEHPYPDGYKSYNKSKPMRIEEFAPEKKWWKKRKESEFAWKVSVKDIVDSNYNLDIKNPHVIDEDHGDPKELLKEYLQLEKDTGSICDKLKAELMASLGGNG